METKKNKNRKEEKNSDIEIQISSLLIINHTTRPHKLDSLVRVEFTNIQLFQKRLS